MYHSSFRGPFFDDALGLGLGDIMNRPNNGFCYTKNFDAAWYNIPEDERGNSVLTGQGSDRKGPEKFFTAAKLEVFGLTL